MSPTDVVLKMAQRWNDGDIEGMLEMYHEDVVMTPSPDWLETVQLKGKDAFRKNTEEWLGTWDSVAMETGRMSGLEGQMPIHVVFTVRDGRIAHLEWCADHESALAAVGDA